MWVSISGEMIRHIHEPSESSPEREPPVRRRGPQDGHVGREPHHPRTTTRRIAWTGSGRGPGLAQTRKVQDELDAIVDVELLEDRT